MSHVFLRGWFSNRLMFCFVFCVFLFRPPSEFLLREGRLTSKRREATEGEDTLTSGAGLFLLSEVSREPFSTTVPHHEKPPLGIQSRAPSNKKKEARRRPFEAGVWKSKKRFGKKKQKPNTQSAIMQTDLKGRRYRSTFFFFLKNILSSNLIFYFA